MDHFILVPHMADPATPHVVILDVIKQEIATDPTSSLMETHMLRCLCLQFRMPNKSPDRSPYLLLLRISCALRRNLNVHSHLIYLNLHICHVGC